MTNDLIEGACEIVSKRCINIKTTAYLAYIHIGVNNL